MNIKLADNKYRYRLFYLFTIIPLLLFLIVRYRVFTLGFVEAGQYWISLGQNYLSPFYSPELGLSDVIKQNNLYNLDPGGFSFILHYWLMLSKNFLWIKLLPFIFFVGFVVYLVKLLNLFLEEEKYLAFLIIPILFISNAIPYYSVFLRAYSMEYFGIVISLYYFFTSDNPKKFYLIGGIICAAFLWSRYSFGIHILALYIISAIKFLKFSHKKLFIINNLYFIIPILISIISVYLITLRYQYIKPTFNAPYIQYMSDGNFKKTIELVVSQFTSILNIPLFILIFLYNMRSIKYLNLPIINYPKLKLLLIYFGCYHLINFTLSYFGLYPYSIYSYNSKQFEFFNLLSIFFITLFIILNFKSMSQIGYSLIFLGGAYLAFKKGDFGTNNVKEIMDRNKNKVDLFASDNLYPIVRYMVEQKIIKSKFKTISVFNRDSIIKAGSLVIIKQSEDLNANNLERDERFKRVDGEISDKPWCSALLYKKK